MGGEVCPLYEKEVGDVLWINCEPIVQDYWVINRISAVMGVCYRLPNQEEVDDVFFT